MDPIQIQHSTLPLHVSVHPRAHDVWRLTGQAASKADMHTLLLAGSITRTSLSQNGMPYIFLLVVLYTPSCQRGSEAVLPPGPQQPGFVGRLSIVSTGHVWRNMDAARSRFVRTFVSFAGPRARYAGATRQHLHLTSPMAGGKPYQNKRTYLFWFWGRI